MEKRINVIIPGAGDEAEAREGPIRPGTTAGDILRAAQLDPQRFLLELQRNGGSVSLAAGDDVYSQVKEGEKIFVRPADMVVG